MIYYRVAIRESHSAIWHWKSPLFNSLHGVRDVLNLYHALQEERIGVFLFTSGTSTQQMDLMLKRANQGKLTTAITVKQLWDARRTNWMEVRRLEIELGEGGEQTLAWTTLLARRARGELLS